MEAHTLATTSNWTFITNHGLVLSYIYRNPQSTAREIADHIGVTERTTHKIISDLELAGYIERRKNGRRNIYRVEQNLPLRHHAHKDVLVSDLLKALSAKKSRRKLAAGRQPRRKPSADGRSAA
jgi:DNA-binding MarR family transcriptional regulator